MALDDHDLGAGLAGAALIGALLPGQAPPAAVRLSAMLPEGQSLSTGDRSVASISPDGDQIVYVAAPGGLYLRTLSESESKPIPGAGRDGIPGISGNPGNVESATYRIYRRLVGSNPTLSAKSWPLDSRTYN